MSPAQARGNKAPGVMQQNRMESRVKINHPWRQGREEEEEEVFCSRASLCLTKPQKPQVGSESWGRIRPAVAPVVPEQSWSWPGALLLQLSRQLVFPSLPSSRGFTLWQAMHRAARSDKMAVPQIYGVYL